MTRWARVPVGYYHIPRSYPPPGPSVYPIPGAPCDSIEEWCHRSDDGFSRDRAHGSRRRSPVETCGGDGHTDAIPPVLSLPEVGAQSLC